MAKRPRKYQTIKTTLGSAVESSYQSLEELCGEMEELRDNLEEHFSSTNKYDMASTAASELCEAQNTVEIPDEVSKRDVSFSVVLPRSKRKSLSRADRCSNACACLEAALEVLNREKDELDIARAENGDGYLSEDQEELLDSLNGAIEEMQPLLDNAQAVEFPGMFAG